MLIGLEATLCALFLFSDESFFFFNILINYAFIVAEKMKPFEESNIEYFCILEDNSCHHN